MVSETTTVQAVKVPAISSPPGSFPPPGSSLADPEVKAPIVIELEECHPHGETPSLATASLNLVIEQSSATRRDLLGDCLLETSNRDRAMSAPPSLAVLLQLDDCLLESKVPTKEKLLLDLQSSILDEKVPPPSLGSQLVEMTLTALKMQIDEIGFQTGVSTEVKQLALEDLIAKGAEVKQSSDQIDPADNIAVPTPLKTALSSKAAPFQPFMSSTWSPQANWQTDDSIGYVYGGIIAS